MPASDNDCARASAGAGEEGAGGGHGGTAAPLGGGKVIDVNRGEDRPRARIPTTEKNDLGTNGDARAKQREAMREVRDRRKGRPRLKLGIKDGDGINRGLARARGLLDSLNDASLIGSVALALPCCIVRGARD